MPGPETTRGAAAARAARADLGLDPKLPIPCIFSAIEQAGIAIVIGSLQTKKLGCCIRAGGQTILWVKAGFTPARNRFTLAHEFGHLHCDHDPTLPPTTLALLNGTTSETREVEANAFAAELLLPEAAVRECLGERPTLEEIVVLSSYFGVSAESATYRARTLDLCDDVHRDELVRRIHAEEHLPMYEGLPTRTFDDVVARLRPVDLPYLSTGLRRTTLGELFAGQCAVADAAPVLGVTPARLTTALGSLGIAVRVD